MRNLATWIGAFVSSAGIVLMAAALVRWLIAADDSQILLMPDPLLGIPVRYVVICVGVIEFAVGWICLFGKSLGIRSALLAWLVTNWAVYQAGLFYMGTSGHCASLGILTDPLRLSGSLPGRMLEFLPVVLLGGAYAAMLLTWLCQRKQPRQNYLKVACPGCGGHIEFLANTITWKIACPHCGGGVRVKNLSKIA